MASEQPITVAEAAERLGVHYMTAYRYVRTGRLQASRRDGQWEIEASALSALESGVIDPASQPTPRPGRQARLVKRMIAGDETGSWAIIEEALVSGAEPADIHTELLIPALHAIGEGWAAGEIQIGDEHQATTVAIRLVGRLGPRFAHRGRTRGTVVLGACAGNYHALGGAILSDLLRGIGYGVIDLGSDSPAESFVGAAGNADQLVAVMVGTAMRKHRRSAVATVEALRRSGTGAKVLVGGPAVVSETDARLIGADGWSGLDASSALEAVVASSQATDANR